ncbi:hypothetical protein ABH935_008837 [Catenulispora sp. GAS73]|uniref:DUF6412 domain-containing protein n=1 Tax=Catenulispora sp. GAS73 TaxID=3156269 RepID=UPI00351212BB
MTHRGATAASLLAAFVTLLVLFGGQNTAVLVASATALTLLAAALRCSAFAVLMAGTTMAAQNAAAARSSLRDTAFLPQRDPDAAGKPHPRAPGMNPVTV